MLQKDFKIECLPFQDNKNIRYIIDGINALYEHQSKYKNNQKIQNFTKPKYLFVHIPRFFWGEGLRPDEKFNSEINIDRELDVYELCNKDLQAFIYQQREKLRNQERETLRYGQIRDETNDSSKSSTPGVYKLFALITHYGEDPNSGKYFTYVSGQRKWHKYTTGLIEETSLNDVLKQKGGKNLNSPYYCIYRLD